jgi:hypothetical protein
MPARAGWNIAKARLRGNGSCGLGHPDQTTSIHSTTSAADWASAAMTSSVPPSQPSAPQADDIQAILWYYGSGAPPQAGIPDRPRPALSKRRPIR